MDANGDMMARFTDYINLFSVVGGIALLLLCYLHGMNYISLKTTGPIRERAKKNMRKHCIGCYMLDWLSLPF